jgi:hypothetical protein
MFRSKQTIFKEILTVQHRRWPGSHRHKSYMTGRTTLNIQTTTKEKRHPKTCQESPEVEKGYNSTFSLTSEPEKGRWLAPRLGRPYPRERPGTKCTGSWVGPRAGLNGCRKSPRNRIRSSDHPYGSEWLYRLSTHIKIQNTQMYTHT